MRSRMAIQTILGFAVFWLGTEMALGQVCKCGPDFCQGDPRYAPRLARAKAAMQHEGYPQDLISLMDKDGACFARIDRAPVNFHIRVYNNNGSQDVEWNEDNERISQTKLKAGEIAGFYKFNTPRAFKCCGEKEYSERPDYDTVHDVNRNIVIQCLKSGDNIVCQ